MCKLFNSPEPPPAPPPPPPPPPEPTPPSGSTANLPKAEAYIDAKRKGRRARSIRKSLQIPLTSSSSGSGVNTGS